MYNFFYFIKKERKRRRMRNKGEYKMIFITDVIVFGQVCWFIAHNLSFNEVNIVVYAVLLPSSHNTNTNLSFPIKNCRFVIIVIQ